MIQSIIYTVIERWIPTSLPQEGKLVAGLRRVRRRCISPYCNILYCITLYCNEMYYTALHFALLKSGGMLPAVPKNGQFQEFPRFFLKSRIRETPNLPDSSTNIFVSAGIKKGSDSFFFFRQKNPLPPHAVVIVVVAAVAAPKGVLSKKRRRRKEKNPPQLKNLKLPMLWPQLLHSISNCVISWLTGTDLFLEAYMVNFQGISGVM